MSHSIMDAAKWFTEKNGGEIGSKKLQNLCYYAQAWSYALRDKSLFIGPFQAWVHGPVNRKLWDTFKDIAYRDITVDDFVARGIQTSPFSPEEEAFPERVWVTYGPFSGYQLEELTHSETPWIEKREGLGIYQSSSRVISSKTMKEFYLHLTGKTPTDKVGRG